MNKKSTIVLTTMAAFAALAAASVMTSSPAQAFETGGRDRAFCFNSPGDFGIGKICSFDTYQQCMATAQGITGTCERNPWYAYDDAPPQYPVRRRVPRAY